MSLDESGGPMSQDQDFMVADEAIPDSLRRRLLEIAKERTK
jgi:hypothetical protein